MRGQLGSLTSLTANQATPIVCKLDRPFKMLEAFPKFQKFSYPALLDSSLGPIKLARYSYLTADPFLILRSNGRDIHIETKDGKTIHLEANPFTVLQNLLDRYQFRKLTGLPPFQGGAIGYFSYELAHHIENLPDKAVNDLRLPEMNVAFYDWTIAVDNFNDMAWAIASGLPEGDQNQAHERLAWVIETLQDPYPNQTSEIFKTDNVTSNYSRQNFLQAVQAVKEYISQGDVYQVNISQRFEADMSCHPWDLYLRLRSTSPAPFAAYLRYPEVTVLSASPEEFIHLENRIIRTRPMKGTRPRGSTIEIDEKLNKQLYDSKKDRAENVMIVDLMRSDLGKVCVPGSINTPELFTIEEYPTVFQMVSTIYGKLRQELSAVDVIRACFPGGSVTGAPKIRAMEIIDELEPTQRSVYCGAIGYISFSGSMLMSIPIRILLAKETKVYFQVGAGIVADSDPQSEYEETMYKAAGSFKTLGIPKHLT